MKSLWKKIFLWLIITIFVIFGLEIFGEYLANHTYYPGMLANGENWKVLILMLVGSLGIGSYVLFSKKFSLKTFILLLMWVVSVIISPFYIGIKWEILWGWLFMIILNSIIIFSLGAYFITGILALGTLVSNKLLKFKLNGIQEMLLNFWLGIGILLIFSQALSGFDLLYSWITWLAFLSLGYFIRKAKSILREYKEKIENMFYSLQIKELAKNKWNWIFLILIVLSLIYYFYGFQLSIVPYPTAWDANHEYMYVPKILAENHGIIRWLASRISDVGFLRNHFISFWFSLFWPLNLWISADNFAISMNYLSALFVLIVWLGVSKSVISYFSEDKDENTIPNTVAFGLSRSMLLLWLTSGMWAFLVFVDNKTDLWVMAMTLIAILSGMVVLNSVRRNESKKINWENIKYSIVSGLMFTLATMAKPTAFIDVVVFGSLMVMLWINRILGIWLWVITIWFMGILSPLNAQYFISPELGKIVIIIWWLITLLGVVDTIRRMNIKSNENNMWINLKYILIRIISFGAWLILLKGPWIFYNTYVNNQNFSVSNFARWLLFTNISNQEKLPEQNNKKDTILLAAVDEQKSLEEQNIIDQEYINEESQFLDLATCQETEFTDEELSSELKEAIKWNEDIWRYVGFGWKDFKKPNSPKLGYYILKTIYPKTNTCYGLNTDAKILCQNKDKIQLFDLEVLMALSDLLDKDSEAKVLVDKAVAAYTEKYGEPQWPFYAQPGEFNDEINALVQYYEDHSVFVGNDIIQIPYRYLIPFNITMNRSLQNLSSYYTDIWFVWLIFFILTVLTWIYAILFRKKKLISLSSVALIGWSIRYLIGGGILWYGIGLIMWTTLVVGMLFYSLLENEENKSNKILIWIILRFLVLLGSIQFIFNFIRISSQWGGWPFLWYRQSVWRSSNVLNEYLQPVNELQYGYSAKDVFDLQFNNYNSFINAVKDRNDEDGVLIAGTYLQYFLHNQKNIRLDNLLNWFWRETSDNNSCKSYQRLKNNNLKYLVIDPNIATVVMGDWNKSLFYKFFGNVDEVTGKLKYHGTLTMIGQMIKDWYVSLWWSNNLGAKYWYSLSDEQIAIFFGTTDVEQILLRRAKLATARFHQTEAQKLITFIVNTFVTRMWDGQALWDIADIYGFQIDTDKVLQAAMLAIAKQQPDIASLTNDERAVLSQYLYYYQLLSSGDQNSAYQSISELVYKSMWASSQLIIFELK